MTGPALVAPTDDDVTWAASALGLPPNAFNPTGSADPRSAVMKNVNSVDVESCPGSGKTTLVVAKLAVFARSWTNTSQGVCVLSHTNAARDEIERVLASEPSARRLLGYPHFIGTIHSFANEFLALPAMRAKGYKAVAMDDALCEAHRRKLLRRNQFASLRGWLANQEVNNANVVRNWRITSVACNLAKANGTPVFVNPGPSATQLSQLGAMCAKDGFYCFSESFVWANHLMDICPSVIAAMRRRFPIVFVDEAQDNNTDQTAFLHRLFSEGADASIVQRFGDSNQAIYNSDEDDEATSAHRFPIAARTVSIPNSYRFAQPIANLADPLGLTPYGLQGLGPKPPIPAKLNQNVIFLFSAATGQHVLDAYCRHLLSAFTAEEIERSDFHAVGSRHRPGDATKFPRSVGNYWAAYDAETPAASPKPSTFFQYVSLARSGAISSSAAFPAVRLISEGLLHLARILDPTFHDRPRTRLTRYFDERLSETKAQQRYKKLLLRFGADQPDVTDGEWNGGIRAECIHVARDLADYSGVEPAEVAAFLQWPAPAGPVAAPTKKSSNVYAYPEGAPQIKVNVGSIHAVKGQTHTATLVLETFYYGHHLKGLLPWLLGESIGGDGQTARGRMRLKTHYVAMTRPTHVLCLAMLDELAPEQIAALQGRGWRLARVGAEGETWL